MNVLSKAKKLLILAIFVIFLDFWGQGKNVEEKKLSGTWVDMM